jgi:hypothetical protein
MADKPVQRAAPKFRLGQVVTYKFGWKWRFSRIKGIRECSCGQWVYRLDTPFWAPSDVHENLIVEIPIGDVTHG